jgi:hypothetical protein
MASTARILISATVLAFMGGGGCGGGTPVGVTSTPASLDVRVSAGAPVAGAIATVYAISDATGEVNSTAGAAGVLGSAGPTGTDGRVIVAVSPYSGPVQVVASGSALVYPDPTRPDLGDGARPLVQAPASFVLSSFVTRYSSRDPMVVPVTLATTLADRAALAYARGRHPLHPGGRTISDALAARDPLFVGHVSRANAWDPATLRTSAPASLTAGPQPLVDVAFAALLDLALNQLARDTSARAGYVDGAHGLDAPAIVDLLAADVEADGKFDGRAGGGSVLQTSGTTPVTLDAQFLRLPLAMALSTWIRDPSVNRSGIREIDLIGSDVFAAIIEDASDLFGDPPAATADALGDRIPPVVAWVVSPPVAVAGTSVALRVAATDERTVSRVVAQIGPEPAVVATQLSNGEWALTIPLGPGPNRISVWAEDDAPTGSNSGRFMGAPHELTTTVISDRSAPSVLYNAQFPAYHDERAMTLAVDGAGQALMPPVYVHAAAREAIPPSGGHVYKAATRLSWTSPPTPSSLEDPATGNPDNIPVLQFVVPHAAGVDAPIASATYSVSVSCPTCSFAPATGALWASATATPDGVLYDLPLSANLVPALASLPGAASVSVSVTVSDAAGNTSTSTPITLTFHTIGPPLAIAEDLEYSTRNDPKSTYPYVVSKGLYSLLFDANTPAFLPENAVRLVRYIVENPASAPVALTLPSFSSGWRMVETWTGNAGTALGTRSYSVGPSMCSNAPQCAGTIPVAYSGGSTGSGCGASPPHNVTPATESPVVTSSTLTSFAYNQVQGGDSGPAQRTGTGQVIVPGASNGAPGTVALYIGRPVATPARTHVLPWSGSSYAYVVEDAWVRTWRGSTQCCEFDAEFRMCVQSDAPSTWSGTRFSRQLTAAVDALEGSFQLRTNGMSGSAAIGETATVPGAVDLTRTIPH